MKKLLLIIFTFFTYVSYGAEYCADDYKCIVKKDREDPSKENLECKLPNMPTFPITAKDVFNVDGSLHDYFGFSATNVCGVLGWMNNAITHLDNFEGLKNDIQTPLTLQFKHLYKSTGGTTVKTAISLDTDTYTAPDVTGNDKTPDGNRHIDRMKYITVHEFLHFIAYNSVRKGEFWVAEGTARAFEDMVYDTENPYADEKAYAPMYGQRYIANTLEDLQNSDYKGFAFFKLLKDKCTLDMSKLLLENVDISSIADNCTNLPNINEDQLSSLFLYYNWVMLLKHDFSLIDSNEPVFPDKFAGILNSVNQKDFKDTLDMKYIVNSTIPAYGAKSFLITHETLASDADMNLTFKASGDLKLVAIRVKTAGISNVDDNFIMDGSNQFYDLTDVDREGGLFVTLVNSTDKVILVKELKLEKGFDCDNAYANGYEMLATYCSYSLGDQGHFWLKDSGFTHISSAAKNAYHNSLKSQYNWCGIYSKNIIDAWKGESYCGEAHVYWNKEVGAKKSNSSQKVFVPLSQFYKVESIENNASYLGN